MIHAQARMELLKWAQSKIGIREVGGNNRGPEVEAFQRAVDGRASGEPWCMAWVQAGIIHVEKKMGIVSPMFRSEHCLTVWRDSHLKCRVRITPRGGNHHAGIIPIWKTGPSSGHTGILVTQGGRTTKTAWFESIEGNTRPSKLNQHERPVISDSTQGGEGVFMKRHSYSPPDSFQLIGFLDPFPEEMASNWREPIPPPF